MTRAILVNNDYVAYGHQKHENNTAFEIEPHATIQALIKAKRERIEGGTLFLWRYPCLECAKAIAYAGVLAITAEAIASSSAMSNASQCFILISVFITLFPLTCIF